MPNYEQQFRFILTTDYDYCDKTTALGIAKSLGYFRDGKLTISDVCRIWREAFGEVSQ